MIHPYTKGLKITEGCALIFLAELHLRMSVRDHVTRRCAAVNRTRKPFYETARVATRAKFDYRLMGSAFD